MYASIKWMQDMLDTELDPRDAAERLTMLGAAVDAVAPVHDGLEDVVVAVVEDVDQHPDADRLTVCQVNRGDRTVEVVCGAPNVRAGNRYPYVPAGGVLPGGVKLTKRKIRGVVSDGMLCSAKELGLGAGETGLMELSGSAAPGTPLVQALGLGDTRLEIDVTPNRPDLLSQRGVARELGAVLQKPVKLPSVPGGRHALAPRRVEHEGVVHDVTVTIEDEEGCPRYVAAVIRGVTVGSSPEWLQARLRSVGARPINNVVDATNYVLHEINQPLHAFDLAKLRGRKLIIRRARSGERLTTLDGVDRALSPEMTMICDAEGPVAIAGVMGGENSEVSDDTTDILLECAYFDPRRIRSTRTALKMDTDASYRFERGIDLAAVPHAARRAVELIIAVAGGTEPEPAVDVCPASVQPTTVFLRPARVAHLLGVPVDLGTIERLLTSVGFVVAPRGERLAVQVPGWRPDVTREVDLIEEVARLRGYDAFPVEMRPYRPTTVPEAPSERHAAVLRRLLTGLGLCEARSMPLGGAGAAEAQSVANPLSAEETFLRTALLPGLVRAVERNWAVRTREVRLFEIGRVFRATPERALPKETLRVAAVLTGARQPPHWTDGGKTPDLDRWDLKGMLEETVRVAVPGSEIVPGEDGWNVVAADGTQCGFGRSLSADSPPWAGALLGFELDLAPSAPPDRGYQPMPVTPAVERDVALVVPQNVSAAAVEATMREAGGRSLERVVVFDEYRAEDLGGRSVAWRLVFRESERTLRDAEVDRALGRILAQLKESLGVERRS